MPIANFEEFTQFLVDKRITFLTSSLQQSFFETVNYTETRELRFSLP